MTALVQAEVDGAAAHRRRAEDVLLPAGDRRQRHGAQRPARRGAGAAGEPGGLPAAARRPGAAALGGRGDAAGAPAGADVPPHRHPRRSSWAARGSRPGTRSSSTTSRPTTTSAASPTRSGSTSPARPTSTCPSGRARTCAWARAFARLQMRAFFTEFLRLPRGRLDGRPRRLTSNFINGITRLPLRWWRAASPPRGRHPVTRPVRADRGGARVGVGGAGGRVAVPVSSGRDRGGPLWTVTCGGRPGASPAAVVAQGRTRAAGWTAPVLLMTAGARRSSMVCTGTLPPTGRTGWFTHPGTVSRSSATGTVTVVAAGRVRTGSGRARSGASPAADATPCEMRNAVRTRSC